MIVLMALIAVSMAITVISEPLRNRFGPQGASNPTTTAKTVIEPSIRSEAKRPMPEPSASILRIDVERSSTARAVVGEPFTLLVETKRPTEVSIPRLGLFAFSDRFAPARFDLLLGKPGRFAIETDSGRRLGEIEVRRR